MPKFAALSNVRTEKSEGLSKESPLDFRRARSAPRRSKHVASRAPRLESLSVFFPVYNERDNIVPLVREALEVLPGIARRFEVILVDDGSTDGSSELVDELAHNHAGLVRAVHHVTNQGYGSAVKSGFAASRNEWVFFTDGDRQFRLEELHEFLQHLRPEVDLLIGYRKVRQDPWHRLVNARLYKWALQLLFDLQVRDVDCAYKLIHRQVVNSMTLKSGGQFVSAEFLIKARRLGFVFAEAGVNHYPRVQGSQTGAKISVILRAMRELVRNYRELKKAA
jgi:glycosyltransferase involved in cell wall biosynthesis